MPADASTKSNSDKSSLLEIYAQQRKLRIVMSGRSAELLLAALALTSLAALLHSHPVVLPQAPKSENRRYRRKVAQLEIGSTPMEYMMQLRSNLSDERGRPKNYTQDPTSVWCFMDKDINEELFREKPANERRCRSVSRYLFSWDSVTKSGIPLERIPLKEGRLRPYLQVINRHVEGGKIIPVELSIELNIFVGGNITGAPSRSSSAQLQSVNVSSESNGWVELDITSALSQVWPPTENQTLAEVRLVAEVDCETFRKVPLNFINPAEIPLERSTRRERHLDLQPLLLVFSDDGHIKEQIAKGQEEIEMGDETFKVRGAEDFDKRRRKRQSSSEDDACRVEDFIVNFADLGLNNIISPHSTNIKRCAGNCSHPALKQSSDPNLATNHAKIMASAQILYILQKFQNGSSMNAVEPKEPCCVPVEYSPKYLIRQQHTEGTDFAIELKLFPNFVVEGCGCR